MEEPTLLVSDSGGRSSSNEQLSQLANDLNAIAQSSKRRALPSSDSRKATTGDRQSATNKSRVALVEIITNQRKLSGDEEEDALPRLPTQDMIERIADHSSHILSGATEDELDRIITLSRSTQVSATHIFTSLMEVGIFDTQSAASIYLGARAVWTIEYIRAFEDTRGWVGLAMMCAILHVSPLVPNTTVLQSSGRLINALVDKYSQGVDEDDIPGRVHAQAKQRLEKAVSAFHLDSEFFSMKKTQVVRDGKSGRSITFAESCPLFSKYDNGHLLSSGNFGVVFKYARRDSLMRADNVPLFCVVKIQKTSPIAVAGKSDAALRELLVMHAIDSKIRSWNTNPMSLITNTVMLYDWAKCRMNLSQVLKPLLTAKDIAKLEVELDARPREYQIIVEEYVPDGTLEDVLIKRMAGDLFWTTRGVAAIYAQLFGFFMPFYSKMAFMHNDFKTPNVLIKRMPIESTVKYLRYGGGSSGMRTMWVPLEDSHGFLFKLADFGLSTITVGSEMIGSPDWSAQPGLDLEVFTCWVLYNCVMCHKENYMINLPPELIRFLRSTILPPLRSDTEALVGDSMTAYDVRYDVVEFLLADSKIGKPAPDWKGDADRFLGIYSYAKSVWRYRSKYPEHRGTVMITRMLESLGQLVGYFTPPVDIAPHNVCNMDVTVAPS